MLSQVPSSADIHHAAFFTEPRSVQNSATLRQSLFLLYSVCMNISSTNLTFPELAARLGPTTRMTLFIRHSERPPIDPNDHTFGKTLTLTPNGERMAHAAGCHFAHIADVSFRASPMVRCHMTARCFAHGMGIQDPAIADTPEIGTACVYYQDATHVQAQMRLHGYMPYMLGYLHTGKAPFSNPLDTATDAMTAWLRENTHQTLNVMVSHDIFVAALLTGLKARHYTAERWVDYLHGVAFIYEDNAWHVHPCSP